VDAKGPDVETEHVGSIVSPATGVVLHVKATPGAVVLVRRGKTLLSLSPALARDLGALLAHAANAAEGGRRRSPPGG
jgi:hypothetical protein